MRTTRLASPGLVVLAVMLLAGCSTTTKPQAAAPPQPKEVLATPEDLREQVERARLLGLAIYTQDAASAVATDVLIHNIGTLEGKGLGGWITVRDADVGGRQTGWWLVKFFSEEAQPHILYEVRVPTRPGNEATYTQINPPAEPDANTRALLRARAAAIAAAPEPTRAMNTVLLPGEPFGFNGTLVYLLAATTDTDVMVLGKHYRVLLTDDDGSSAQVAELSRTQLEVPLKRAGKPAGARIVAPYVKHTLTDAPLESFVFASLFHRVPILVATGRGVWWVDGSDIQYISETVPERPGQLLR